MNKLTAKDIRIERLTKDFDLTNFISYEKELVAFLKEDALDNQEKMISVTYLWLINETNELCGYLTLLNDKINLEGDLKEIFKNKGILYKSLPALKIGRLCVDDRFLRRDLGTLMVLFAIQKAKEIYLEKSGCRFITLDAKRNKDISRDSIHFYKYSNFNILKERNKGATPMFLDLFNK
ncbi:MAG: hypothetical protein PHN56_06935 [Candidatus Nanoarchaeia archaeon]|nr:hypothetical protein [Candidatus Nanoarchaeia archaeon]